MAVPATRQPVRRPASRPRPPVAERGAPAARRMPVPDQAALQQRWGNRGTARLLSLALDESRTPAVPGPPVAEGAAPFAEAPVPFAEAPRPLAEAPAPFPPLAFGKP